VIRLLAAFGCALAGEAPGAAGAPPPGGAVWLDPGSDLVLARSAVPSPERRVGEVRLIRRGEADVVQTLLYTKVLRRVVGEIRRKELSNWPEGPGHEDALHYVDVLAAVQQRIWARLSASKAVRDRRQKMWIEFVLAPGAALVACGAFEMDEPAGEVRVLRRETLMVLEPSPDYVRRNMRLIAADAFHAEGAALDELLAPLALLRAPAGGRAGASAADRREPPLQED